MTEKKKGDNVVYHPHPKLDGSSVMIAVIAVLLIFMFLNVLISNPTITSMGVVSAETQDTERFSAP